MREYLGVKRGERFLIVGDLATSKTLMQALYEAALSVEAEAVSATIVVRSHSGQEPPAYIAAAMRESDVVLCAASTSLYHTAAKAAAHRAGVRGVFNAPHRLDAWTHGAMTADFFEIRDRAGKLADLLRRTRHIRVTSPAGTDLSAETGGREPFGWLAGICHSPGEVSAYPGGEVSLPPLEGTSHGRIVWEAIATDLGRLERPVAIDVAGGRAVAVSGGSSAENLRRVLAHVDNADNVGEIGIGLNPRARLSSLITEAKKRAGTVHIALGDNANEYGGVTRSAVHMDGLVLRPTIEFDGVALVVNGEHKY